MSEQLHVVVVDDDPTVRETIEEYLDLHGIRASSADGGAALRRILAAEQVHIVLLDLDMPGEDGLSLARYLREFPDIGVIMVTASAETVDRVVGLEMGADDYLAKPFDLRELLARIKSLRRRLAKTATAPQAPTPGGRSILVVDDEPFIAEILAEFLGADGHRVEIAASGREALEKLGGAEYDLIVSDMRMPDIDGPALYRRLESEHPRYLERIVFITGDTLGLDVDEFIEKSGRPCIEKPFTPEDVRAAVEEVLTAAKAVVQGR